MRSLRSLSAGSIAGLVAVLVLVTASAAFSFAQVPDTSPAPGEQTISTSLAVGSQMAVPVHDAGTVTISRDAVALSVVSAVANPGWMAEVEVATGREVEVDFRSASLRHQVNIELEDGEVRVRIRTSDNGATTTSVPGSTSTSTSTSTVPGSTSTTSTVPGSTSTTSTTSTTLPVTNLPARTIDVLDAGTATFSVDGGSILLSAVHANAGWTVNVERSVGREVEATWRGPGRVDLNLELEDGAVRVRIRDRRTDSRTETWLPADSSGGSTTSTVPTSTIPSSTVPTSTVPTSTLPTTSTASRTETVSAAGGTVTVRIDGGTVTLVSAVPAPGYSVDVRDAGPDDVEVRFESGNNESRIEIDVDDGRLEIEREDR